MKTCPVCQANAFDDADMCYGCLYKFPDEDDLAERGRIEEDELLSPPFDANIVSAFPPAFLIKLKPPSSEAEKLWTCSVEPVRA